MAVHSPSTTVAEHVLRRAYSPGPRALRRSWVIAVTVGETLGFAVPAVMALVAFDLHPAATLALMVLAGAGEGLLLGTAQAIVLKREFLGFSRTAWIGVTVVGACSAWFLGMLPSTFHDTWSDWPTAAVALSGIVLGGMLLATIGFAQWFVLRHHVARARTWMPVNGLAWVLAMLALVAVTTPMWHEGEPPVVVALVGVVGGLVMASTVAWVTGIWLVRLVHPPAVQRPAPAGVPEHEWRALASSTDAFQVFDPSLVQRLPEPVQRWLLHAITPGAAVLTSTEVESSGQIRLGGSWRALVCRQRSSLLQGYVWASRTRLLGLPVAGFDRFTHGSAEMRWRILRRFPLVSADGEQITRSSAGRHAAEILAAVPAAALDRSLRWQTVDRNRATAELLLGGDTQHVTVTVDAIGRLERVELDRWGTPPGSTYGLYRFGAVFEEERLFDGYRIPTVVTAGWHPGTDQWDDGVFLRYRVLRSTFR